MKYFWKCLMGFLGIFLINFFLFLPVVEQFFICKEGFLGSLIMRGLASILSIGITCWFLYEKGE